VVGSNNVAITIIDKSGTNRVFPVAHLNHRLADSLINQISIQQWPHLGKLAHDARYFGFKPRNLTAGYCCFLGNLISKSINPRKV